MRTTSQKIKARAEAGFTLIEVIVIVAILAILAGILAPMIFSQIDEAKISRAMADAKSINSAIMVFRKDTGQWPNKVNECEPVASLLNGDGALPTNLAAFGFDSSQISGMSSVLAVDGDNCYPETWKGPYITSVTTDPWGNAYVINADGFNLADTAVFVYSAGPDGVMNSFAGSMSTGGDDIAIRIK